MGLPDFKIPKSPFSRYQRAFFTRDFSAVGEVDILNFNGAGEVVSSGVNIISIGGLISNDLYMGYRVDTNLVNIHTLDKGLNAEWIIRDHGFYIKHYEHGLSLALEVQHNITFTNNIQIYVNPASVNTIRLTSIIVIGIY